VYDFGDVHVASAAPSSEHLKVAPVSLAVKVNAIVVVGLGSGVMDVIVVSGAGVDTENVRVCEEGPALPAASTARTRQ
jgi:hypothetical protein